MKTKIKNKLPGFVADSYFAAAIVISNDLIDYIEKNKSLEGSVNSPHHLIYPAVFNFKNGIELWLKNFQVMILGQSDKTTHDLRVLIDSLINAAPLSNHKNKATIIKNLQSVKQILIPYYSGAYLGSDGTKPDKNNEAERFPESKSANVYCPVDHLNFEVSDHQKVKNIANKLKDDIKKLREQIMLVFFGFARK